jgi:hypothetical protein
MLEQVVNVIDNVKADKDIVLLKTEQDLVDEEVA